MSDEQDSYETDDDKFTVLEVFGLKLEVSNPRLADLLTMDASEALTSDVKDLRSPESVRDAASEARQGMPDVVLTPVSPREENEAESRQAMRAQAAALGESMGFTTHVDGVWESPTGVTILTRMVDATQSFASASHFVDEIAERRTSLAGEESTVLFVVPNQQTADVFKVAIRQARAYHLMRTVSVENLEAVAALHASEQIDHNQAVILLAPVADIDVGEILAVIRTAGNAS